MIQKLFIGLVLTIVPLSVVYGQEDIAEDALFDDTIFTEEVFPMAGTTNEIEPVAAPADPAATNIEETTSVSDTEIYSNDSNEIILYRAGEEVKRLPKDLTIPTPSTSEPEPIVETPTEEVEKPAAPEVTTTEVIEVEATATGVIAISTGTSAASGDEVESEPVVAATETTSGGLLSGSLLLYLGAIIVVIIVAVIFLRRSKKPKLDAVPDVPQGTGNTSSLDALEEKLAALKQE